MQGVIVVFALIVIPNAHEQAIVNKASDVDPLVVCPSKPLNRPVFAF